ncbi:hypothetical protein SAY87_018418 [Trapa incisa]|uniref:Small EDRK-rich factor-like N-terminal domain-containing protein n=1 Tax=Trapa incisa TaxID=236973 RepID=A0AAN7QVD3_9MYRT|nr:hypothetical protein SAY87_018418 [Trapa incisa]
MSSFDKNQDGLTLCKHSNNREDVMLWASVFSLTTVEISRGNQRDRDRERAQAKSSKKGSQNKDDGLTPEQRRERDAKALQEKAAKKAAQAAGGGDAGGKSSNKK